MQSSQPGVYERSNILSMQIHLTGMAGTAILSSTWLLSVTKVVRAQSCVANFFRRLKQAAVFYSERHAVTQAVSDAQHAAVPSI
jgi:hypothetical protein